MKVLHRVRSHFSGSLLTQGMAATIVLHTASAFLLLAIFLFVLNRTFLRQLELRGESIGQFLSSELQFALLVGDRVEVQRLLDISSANQDVLFLEVLDTHGKRICASGRADLLERRGPALSSIPSPKQTATFSPPREGVIDLQLPVLAPNRSRLLEWEQQKDHPSLGTLRMGLSVQKQRSLIRQMLMGGACVTLLGLAMMCGAQFWGLRRLLRPLNSLVGFAHRVGAGDLRPKAPVDRDDEVGQLAAAFNAMVEKLSTTTVSKDYLDNVLRSMGEALIVTDSLGRIHRVNPRAVELLGYAEKELIEREAITLVHEGDVRQAASGMERTYVTSSGRHIPVLLSSAQLRGPSGAVEGFVWVAQDLTQLKRIQAELVAARDAAQDANRAKSAFLANMSHELRTPLNAIIGYSQMLLEDYIGPDNEQVRSDLEKIERSGHLLLGIITDILDLSKIEAGRETVKLQNVDISTLLKEVCNTVQPLARQQGNVLEVDCPEPARVAYIDPAKFRQSLLNLVNNACKFTENGRIAVAVERVRHQEADWIDVHVSDTGIGISPQNLPKLFRPFSQVDGSSTRKHGGTGLGLAISKKFCQMMGGDIMVLSHVGRGSRFSIRVPAGRCDAA
ncbi:MAG: ATP-binding protein [Bryobacteraceae bacterium]